MVKGEADVLLTDAYGIVQAILEVKTAKVGLRARARRPLHAHKGWHAQPNCQQQARGLPSAGPALWALDTQSLTLMFWPANAAFCVWVALCEAVRS